MPGKNRYPFDLPDYPFNFASNPSNIGQHFLIGKAENKKASPLKFLCLASVLRLFCIMRNAVNLYNQLNFLAHKIGYVL